MVQSLWFDNCWWLVKIEKDFLQNVVEVIIWKLNTLKLHIEMYLFPTLFNHTEIIIVMDH